MATMRILKGTLGILALAAISAAAGAGGALTTAAGADVTPAQPTVVLVEYTPASWYATNGLCKNAVTAPVRDWLLANGLVAKTVPYSPQLISMPSCR